MVETRTTSTEAPPLRVRWVARIFDRLTRQFGSAKMADAYVGLDDEKLAQVQEEWAQGLAGFDPREIERGLRACQWREWPPSSVGEFARLCRPALDPEFAFYEAQRGLMDRDRGLVGVWSHPAVWRAACTMASEVRAGPYRALRKRWEYELQREFVQGWGEPVPLPNARLGHQRPRTGPPPEEVRQRLAELRAEYVVDIQAKEGER